MEEDIRFFDERSAEYAAAFQKLVACDRDGERELLAVVRSVCEGRGRAARAVDWGAGTGRITRELCARFDDVVAVEPSASMRERLAVAAPTARALAATIDDVALPERVEVAVLSHVLYHVPDHLWGATVVRCARQLADDGVLLVVLKHPESGCNAMLEAFGAARYDLYRLAATLRRHPEYVLELRAAPGRLCTSSLADTLEIARFMLCDRKRTGFTRLPSEREFAAWVARHFWDEARGAGGWDLPQAFALIRPNPAWPARAGRSPHAAR
ncbi:MAG: methyltransferase domain-containing protein [Thermodesulfobacteriota bacterium]